MGLHIVLVKVTAWYKATSITLWLLLYLLFQTKEPTTDLQDDLFYFPYINEATAGLQDILDQDKLLYDFCHESEK